jgi:hypothetical protein
VGAEQWERTGAAERSKFGGGEGADDVALWDQRVGRKKIGKLLEQIVF